jgi:hypothetical protein
MKRLTPCSLEFSEYEADVKKYCWREQLDPRGFSLSFEISKDSSFSLSFADWISAGADGSTKTTATLVGTAGRRLQVKKPEKLLRDAVINQEGVQEWLRTQASVSWKAKFGHYRWKAPEIWMCTGIQLVTHGNVRTGASNSASVHAGAGGDFGPAVGLPPGVVDIHAEGARGHLEEANNGYGYDDERIWAAQFMEVNLEYGEGEDDAALAAKLQKHDAVPKTIASFKLKEVADLKVRGIRASPARRAEGEETRPVGKTPKFIGRVTVDDGSDSGEDGESGPGIQIDDTRYVDALRDTNWDNYRDCAHYLHDKERGNAS